MTTPFLKMCGVATEKMKISTKSEKGMYKFGLVSVSFREYSPEEILSEMKKCCLEYIEWGSDIHAPTENKKRIEELKFLQEKYKMKTSSYGTYFRAGVNKSKEIYPYIENALALGTNTLRIWCGDKSMELYKEEKKVFFSSLKELDKIAREEKVTLSFECHNNTYTNSVVGALELMEMVSEGGLKMYWQPNQYKSVEENLEYAEKIAPYVDIIHVFNWQKDERIPLSEGIDVWKKYLDKFGDNKTLLLEFMPDNRLNSLRSEADALYKIAR